MKKYCIITIFLFIHISALLATGPSEIHSEINPVSINNKGEILCRTRFMKNDLGALFFQPTTYGYCVITNGKIIRYGEQTIEPDYDLEYDQAQEIYEKMDRLFNSPIDFENLSAKEKDICNYYGFVENNVSQFKIDKDIHISNFEKAKGLNLKKVKQLALSGATSTNYCKKMTVHVAYDFNHTIILTNRQSTGWGEDVCVGADFNYQNPFTENGKTINVGYEISIISGIIFK